MLDQAPGVALLYTSRMPDLLRISTDRFVFFAVRFFSLEHAYPRSTTFPSERLLIALGNYATMVER